MIPHRPSDRLDGSLRLTTISLLLLLALSTLSFLPSVGRAASNVVCGETITSSIALTGSIICTGSGLTVSGNGITLNCAGYSITGSPVQPGGIPYAGIEVAAGSNGVTVENCTVLHYEWGIYVVSATHTLLTHNVAMGNPAFWVKGGSFNSLTSNTALNVDEPPCCYYIGAAGFVLSSTSSDTLSGNSAVGTFTGYYLASSNSNSLTGNTANAFCCGYTLDASSYNTIQGNKENGVLGSEVCFVASFGFSATDYSSYNNFVNNWVGGVGDGYFVSSSSSNSFRSNTATLTCNGFEIDSGSSNRLVSNVANLNDRNGFYLPGGASKNVMLLNTADGNSGNGFQLSAGTFSNKVFENKANGNSGYGYYDGSLGHETAGTANRYIADSCFGDLTAGSSPSGLCI